MLQRTQAITWAAALIRYHVLGNSGSNACFLWPAKLEVQQISYILTDAGDIKGGRGGKRQGIKTGRRKKEAPQGVIIYPRGKEERLVIPGVRRPPLKKGDLIRLYKVEEAGALWVTK